MPDEGIKANYAQLLCGETLQDTSHIHGSCAIEGTAPQETLTASTLSVTDDGVGLSPAKSVSDLARVGKLGLLGMKERAELVGGSFEVRSSPGKGTRLEVAVVPGDKMARQAG